VWNTEDGNAIGVAFDSVGIDRLDRGVCERGGDKREGFTFFNITRIASIFFKQLEARERSNGRCGRAKDIYIINVSKDQAARVISLQDSKDV
jgi:hypothetical protein